MKKPSHQWTVRFPIWNWLRHMRTSWKLGMLGGLTGVTLISANLNKRPPAQLDSGTYIGYLLGSVILIIGSLTVVGILLGMVYEKYVYIPAHEDGLDEPPTN